MARCENCLHFHLCVNMEHQHLRMLLAGDKAERCNYFESKADVAPIADTVRKMHSEIKERCIKGGIYPAFVASTIDQIAKEMVEGGEMSRQIDADNLIERLKESPLFYNFGEDGLFIRDFVIEIIQTQMERKRRLTNGIKSDIME